MDSEAAMNKIPLLPQTFTAPTVKELLAAQQNCRQLIIKRRTEFEIWRGPMFKDWVKSVKDRGDLIRVDPTLSENELPRLEHIEEWIVILHDKAQEIILPVSKRSLVSKNPKVKDRMVPKECTISFDCRFLDKERQPLGVYLQDGNNEWYRGLELVGLSKMEPFNVRNMKIGAALVDAYPLPALSEDTRINDKEFHRGASSWFRGQGLGHGSIYFGICAAEGHLNDPFYGSAPWGHSLHSDRQGAKARHLLSQGRAR